MHGCSSEGPFTSGLESEQNYSMEVSNEWDSSMCYRPCRSSDSGSVLSSLLVFGPQGITFIISDFSMTRHWSWYFAPTGNHHIHCGWHLYMTAWMLFTYNRTRQLLVEKYDRSSKSAIPATPSRIDRMPENIIVCNMYKRQHGTSDRFT